MIDWFASKMGLLIFVLAATAMLLAFFFVQSDIYSGAQAANAATDIARLIEGVDDGGTVTYPMNIGNYNLEIFSDHLNLNGFVRYFFVPANPLEITTSPEKISITKSSGLVQITAA